MQNPPRQCLSIAGSDSGGGAGIQADLKAMHANGVFGMSVLCSITAQNTQAVTEAFDLPLDLVRAQLDAIWGDFEVAAVKTGMLSSAPLVSLVANFLRELPDRPPLVIDPVMISKSGFSLLAADAVALVRDELLPLATLVTPNRYEAELLADCPIQTKADLLEAGRRILALGPAAVLLKGGHLDGPGFDSTRAVDFLFVEDEIREFSSPRFATRNTHGTGCTYSAAICAQLGRGLALPDAVSAAKRYIAGAIEHGLAIGRGHGPTDHFWFLDDPATLHANEEARG
ncbi:MAG: bifunctional hydroxymethylpyrimidine kinase/phosphomethylpyrimidine kinase [Candidatus Eisenbacteria bacterium]|nr:bifunctional hydroxymethylpyrimidine kinase/phosphomethylpyrimidine kinase [Candidatus Eisenbacteria bacterium]